VCVARAGFVTSPSWNAFLNCTCPIAGTGAGRRRKLQSLDQLLPGATQHVTGMVPAPPGGQSWSSQWGSSGSSQYGDWSGYGSGTQPGGGGMKFFGECAPRPALPPPRRCRSGPPSQRAAAQRRRRPAGPAGAAGPRDAHRALTRRRAGAHRCKQNLLTLQATCNFVFDYADRRLLDVLSKIQPAGGIPAGGTLQFQFCSINLGGSVVTSSTCFESYGGNKPVIVKIASRSATDTLPPIGFNACYTDKYGSPNKCLVFTIAQSCTGGVQPSYSNNVPSTQWEASIPGVQKGSASWGQSWGPAPPGWAGSWGGDSSWGQSWTPSAPPPPGHLASAGAAVDSVISGIASVAGKGLNGAATLGGASGGGGGVGQAAASDWPQQAAQVAEAQAAPAAGQQARAQATAAGSAAGRAPAAPAAPAAQSTPGAAPQVRPRPARRAAASAPAGRPQRHTA